MTREGNGPIPIWVDADGIEFHSLFFDDGGTAYYTRREGSDGIVQAEIDVRTGEAAGETAGGRPGFLFTGY